jgi:hypothetical protein
MDSPLLQKLKSFIATHPSRAFFGKPAAAAAIARLEAYLGRSLPPAHRQFLRHSDGGFISLMGEKGDEGWTKGDAAWNSNTFLSVVEIRKEFSQLRKLGLDVFGWEGAWPFVPFLRTANQETLVFGPAKRDGDSPVLDAFHEVGPDEWDVAFRSFDSLLRAYVKGEGEVEVIA